MPRYAAELCDLSSMGDGQIVSVSEAALILEMDKRAVRGLVKAGVLQRRRVSSTDEREMRIVVASLKSFIAWMDSSVKRSA